MASTTTHFPKSDTSTAAYAVVRAHAELDRRHQLEIDDRWVIPNVRRQIERVPGGAFWEQIQLDVADPKKALSAIGGLRGTGSHFVTEGGLQLPPDLMDLNVFLRSRDAILESLTRIGARPADTFTRHVAGRVVNETRSYSHDHIGHIGLSDAYVTIPGQPDVLVQSTLMMDSLVREGRAGEHLTLLTGSNPTAVLLVLDGYKFVAVVQPSDGTDPIAFWVNAKLEHRQPLSAFAQARGWEHDIDASTRLGADVLKPFGGVSIELDAKAFVARPV